MQVEIAPEPTPAEREAVAKAVERLLDPSSTPVAALYASAWRLAGLRESAGLVRAD